MKKTVKTFALFLGMSLVAVSCQKENVEDFQTPVLEQAETVTMHYVIDGEVYQTVFANEQAWNDFLDYLIGLAEEGHRVSFRRGGNEQRVSKDVVTYVTTDHDKAHAWAYEMGKAGYEVSISYDEKTKEYTCIAIK